MNYIVLDLEWNQSNTGDEEEVKQIPFEIIDFGAIKLNNRDEMIINICIISPVRLFIFI